MNSTPAASNSSGAPAYLLDKSLRFIWQMNADGCFTRGVENFAQIVGLNVASVLNRPWPEIAATINIDAKGDIGRALAARETWSGIITHWPLAESNEFMPIEMSGLPVYNRDRQFIGYRGFAICRNKNHFEALRPSSEPSSTEKTTGAERDTSSLQTKSEFKMPALSPSEHDAFQALARELIERLKKSDNKIENSKSIGAMIDGERSPASILSQIERPPRDSIIVAKNSPSGKREHSYHQLQQENIELKAVLDTAADGVLVFDHTGHILSANRSAQALFGYDTADFNKLALVDLFAFESRQSMIEYLDALRRDTLMLDIGREAIGLVHQGGLVPLYITMGRIEGSEKFCAILRDVTVWKRTEEELISARKQAEKASIAKSEFLAKISHEIRTPLNAIIGFSEMMMEERFGLLGSERGRQYLNNIHTSGSHLMALLNDVLDISRIEAGKLNLIVTNVDLKMVIQECVAILQDQANRECVIIRTSFPTRLPTIVADTRSVRQIILNILSNAIKFTGAGGQVIASIVVNDGNEVIFRVRDTGAGIKAGDLQTALEPFGLLASGTGTRLNGTGLGLPITKALADANQARLRISSQIHGGTLVEIAFRTTSGSA